MCARFIKGVALHKVRMTKNNMYMYVRDLNLVLSLCPKFFGDNATTACAR